MRSLERQLEAERQAHAETRRIAAMLAQRPALEAPRDEREAPQTTAEDAGDGISRTTTGEAQEDAQPRSWWRRWFGRE